MSTYNLLLDMHGNHHHHHQRTDLGGIMSITSVFTIGPFVPCTPLCKILNTSVMSICLVKQNDGTLVEKRQRFFIQRLQTFFVTFLRFLTFLNVFFFWNVFFTTIDWIWRIVVGCIDRRVVRRLSVDNSKRGRDL